LKQEDRRAPRGLNRRFATRIRAARLVVGVRGRGRRKSEAEDEKRGRWEGGTRDRGSAAIWKQVAVAWFRAAPHVRAYRAIIYDRTLESLRCPLPPPLVADAAPSIVARSAAAIDNLRRRRRRRRRRARFLKVEPRALSLRRAPTVGIRLGFYEPRKRHGRCPHRE